MTDNKNFDLEGAMHDWQSGSGPSIEDAAADARRALNRWRLTFFLEFGVAAAGLVAGTAMALSGNLLIGGAAVGLSVTGAAAALLSRRQTRRSRLHSVSDEIQLLHQEVRMSRRLGCAGLIVCLAALVFMAIVFVSESQGETPRRPMWLYGLGLAFIFGGVWVSLRMIRKARRREDFLRGWQAEGTGDT